MAEAGEAPVASSAPATASARRDVLRWVMSSTNARCPDFWRCYWDAVTIWRANARVRLQSLRDHLAPQRQPTGPGRAVETEVAQREVAVAVERVGPQRRRAVVGA